MRFATVLLSALLVLSSFSAAHARDWDDLHEQDTHVFGSEKEKKYPKTNPFWEEENWEGHYAICRFFVYKYTDYPKYTSTRFFPFYYGLDSKIDNRSYKFCPLFLIYGETDGNEDFRINPAFIDYTHNRTASSNYYERVNLSLVHVYWSEEWKKDSPADRIFWAPIVPLIYRHTTAQGGHQNIFWLFDYAWDTKPDGTENLSRFWIFPLFLHSPGDDGYTTILPPFFVWNRHADGEKWMHLFPLFFHDRSIDADYSSKTASYTYTNTKFSPILGCYYTAKKESWDGDTITRRFWFPIIPLFYSYYHQGVESHRNAAWIFDWHNDANNETDRFWALPAFMWKKSSYTHVPALLYFHFRDEELSSY